jgi:hypothetical protein
MSDTRPHDQQHRDGFLARLRARLSYANVTATLALFLALTGTATAAVVLPRDSVGSEQIQADAVRGSKILDESVVLADLSPGARASLDAPRVRVDVSEDRLQSVSTCDWDYFDCENLMAVHLPAGRWLIQAKLTVSGYFSSDGTGCALVQDDSSIIDEMPYIAGNREDLATAGPAALNAVLTTDVESTTVAVRCYERWADWSMGWGYGDLTAIEVKGEGQED